jgi:hypothetical protein
MLISDLDPSMVPEPSSLVRSVPYTIRYLSTTMYNGQFSQKTCEYVERRILDAGSLHNQLDVFLDGAGKVQTDRQLGVLADGAGRRLHRRVRQLEILTCQTMKWIRAKPERWRK